MPAPPGSELRSGAMLLVMDLAQSHSNEKVIQSREAAKSRGSHGGLMQRDYKGGESLIPTNVARSKTSGTR